MGYAERRRRAFWWQLWQMPGWKRLFRVWPLWTIRATFRGQFWAWVRGVKPVVREDDVERFWVEVGRRVRDRAHLEELLGAVKDERQRALIRKTVRGLMKGKG